MPTIDLDTVQLAYDEAGDPGAPLAVCLHGFPDTASTWRHLLAPLADAGFHAVAPTLRGYAPSGLAADGAYQVGAIAADTIALHDRFGGGRPGIVIGHDWGALGAYGAAAGEPDRWSRVVAMAVPPGPVVADAFFSFEQLRRSWYMFFFQNPLAEAAVAADDFAFVKGLWQEWSPGYDGSADAAAFVEACGEPDRLSAALAYYRSMIGGVGLVPAYQTLQDAALTAPPQPTMYLHGADDGCMGAGLAIATGDHLVEGSQLHIVEGTGHFLHLERPAEVNRLVVDFVAG